MFSRDSRHAAELTGRLYQAEVHGSLDFSESTSGLFIVSVADDALISVIRELVLPDDATIVHTSGSQPLTILQDSAATGMGVLYPLQTFSKDKKIDWKAVPFFVEAGDDRTQALLMELAAEISPRVYPMQSEQRLALHVAGVFASNFSNYMLTVAADILRDQLLSFDYLKPLIVETINKAMVLGPEEGQSGPARRGDLEILDRHLEFLQEDAKIAEIYRLISQQIIDHYHTTE